MKIGNRAKVLRVRLATATCKSELVSRPNHDRVKNCITVGVAAATHLSRVGLIPVSRDILLYCICGVDRFSYSIGVLMVLQVMRHSSQQLITDEALLGVESAAATEKLE